MTSLEIGSLPQQMTLNLATGGDFEATLTLTNTSGSAISWPAGTSLALVFENGSSWSATISGTDAVWNVDKATADAPTNAQKVRLVYANGTTDRVLWAGKVRRG